MTISVKIKRLPHAQGIELPRYESVLAAGMDLQAAIETPVTVKPLERRVIPTGFSLSIPDGYEAQIRPRSGLALKQGLSVPNSPGTIDADYRGEVGVLLINHGKEPFVITRGMRIAQMIIAPYSRATWQATDDLEDTARGAGGFGSTGTEG